jgi:hypothetical protein
MKPMRKQYRREDLGTAVRGKHYAAYARGCNLVLLQPDVAAAFPTATAVNDALKGLLKVARTAKLSRTKAPSAASKSASRGSRKAG